MRPVSLSAWVLFDCAFHGRTVALHVYIHSNSYPYLVMMSLEVGFLP